MQLLKILPPWPGCDPLTSHNHWLLNLEPCTLHSSPPAPPNPTQLLGGGKDYQRKLQRVRTSTSTIGVPDAGSNCYLHKGSPFNVYNRRSTKFCFVTCAGGLFCHQLVHSLYWHTWFCTLLLALVVVVSLYIRGPFNVYCLY